MDLHPWLLEMEHSSEADAIEMFFEIGAGLTGTVEAELDDAGCC